MHPLLIASALAGIASWVKGQFGTDIPEYDPEDWQKYYSPGRIQAKVAPVRSSLMNQEALLRGRSAERFGGRGLPSGAAHRAEGRAISAQTAQFLSEALGRATTSEMETAQQTGLTKYKLDLEKALQERSSYSQLGTTLMAPAMMKYGYGLGGLPNIDKLQQPKSLPDFFMDSYASQELTPEDVLTKMLEKGYQPPTTQYEQGVGFKPDWWRGGKWPY